MTYISFEVFKFINTIKTLDPKETKVLKSFFVKDNEVFIELTFNNKISTINKTPQFNRIKDIVKGMNGDTNSSKNDYHELEIKLPIEEVTEENLIKILKSAICINSRNKEN